MYFFQYRGNVIMLLSQRQKMRAAALSRVNFIVNRVGWDTFPVLLLQVVFSSLRKVFSYFSDLLISPPPPPSVVGQISDRKGTKNHSSSRYIYSSTTTTCATSSTETQTGCNRLFRLVITRPSTVHPFLRDSMIIKQHENFKTNVDCILTVHPFLRVHLLISSKSLTSRTITYVPP